MPKTKTELPELDENQMKFLRAYRRLEREIGKGPSLQQMFDALPGVYSHKSGVQAAMDRLHDLGLIVKPQWRDGSTTERGRLLLEQQQRRRK